MKEITAQSKSVKFHIWDTGGQEKHYSLARK
jgi:GTPase SAR1 family protein